MRKTIEQKYEDACLKAAALKSKLTDQRRRADTRTKVLLGAAALAAKDERLIARLRDLLSETDRAQLDEMLAVRKVEINHPMDHQVGKAGGALS